MHRAKGNVGLKETIITYSSSLGLSSPLCQNWDFPSSPSTDLGLWYPALTSPSFRPLLSHLRYHEPLQTLITFSSSSQKGKHTALAKDVVAWNLNPDFILAFLILSAYAKVEYSCKCWHGLHYGCTDMSNLTSSRTAAHEHPGLVFTPREKRGLESEPKVEENVLSATQYWDSKQGPPIPWTAPNTSSIALKMKTSGLFCRKRKTGLQTFKPHFRQAPFRGHGNLHKWFPITSIVTATRQRAASWKDSLCCFLNRSPRKKNQI